MPDEKALSFDCLGETLIGILHIPEKPTELGLVLVVGGPQYRVGSHRQFTLLARALAIKGIAVLRFDCRGMGDSTGEFPTFEALQPDIEAATDTLIAWMPSLKHIALWGLCDAASAISFYAPQDRRISGLALLNPWVRSEAGYARTQMKHYYLERLTDGAFLRKLVTGKLDVFASARSLLATLKTSVVATPAAKTDASPPAPIADRICASLSVYRGKLLLIMSGRDLTAREFDDAARRSRKWQKILGGKHSTRHDFEAADHTFSRRLWRDQVAEWTTNWMLTLHD